MVCAQLGYIHTIAKRLWDGIQKHFWLSLQRKPQTVLMGVNIPLCQHGIQYQPDAIYTMSIKDNPLSLL